MVAADGEGGMDEDVGVAVEFEDEEEDEEEEELREVVVSAPEWWEYCGEMTLSRGEGWVVFDPVAKSAFQQEAGTGAEVFSVWTLVTSLCGTQYMVMLCLRWLHALSVVLTLCSWFVSRGTPMRAGGRRGR